MEKSIKLPGKLIVLTPVQLRQLQLATKAILLFPIEQIAKTGMTKEEAIKLIENFKNKKWPLVN